MRRTVTFLVVLAVVAAVALTVVWVAAGTGGQPASATVSASGPPTPSPSETPSGTPTETTAGSPAGAGSPADYARITFDAWQGGDAARLIRHSSLPAVQLLLARAPGEETWEAAGCEGAAGSTYCAWAGEAPDRILSSQLVLRVGSEAATAGDPHAVSEAFFAPVSGGVAIWPLSTAEQAENTQSSVDEGHSPWMADPATVVEFFASAELGWEQPVVEPLTDTTFRVTDRATGVAADAEVAQPARAGEDGIWAVTRLGSVSG